MGTMRRYRIPFNKHFRADKADEPTPARLVFRGSDAESALNAAYDYRDAQDGRPVVTSAGDVYWIGMIHPSGVELA